MTLSTRVSRDWASLVERLGGADALERSARETKAFLRPRVVSCAVDLLRLVLSYCLGKTGLRSTAGWAAAVGLADMSDVALLYRLRQCGPWLEYLVSRQLSAARPKCFDGRLVRVVDATNVPKAGVNARKTNRVWRIHSAFDLPSERFGHFVLTDQGSCETLDRIPVEAGEIRIGDRAYMHVEGIAGVIEAGADVVVRAGWKSAKWHDAQGQPFDLIAALRAAAPKGGLDCAIRLARKGRRANPKILNLRLVAAKKSPEAAEAARKQAILSARRGQHKVTPETLEAAGWLILVTTLPADAYSTTDILDLYRLRWRIEIAFKRLKSLIGLEGPPGIDERSARPWILAHLLVILLLEPLLDELEDSPRLPNAA